MVKMLLNDREPREKEIAAERERMDGLREEERLRQAQENDERLAEMRRQIERLQEMFHEHSSAPGSARDRRSPTDLIKLTRLSEEDDVESYLTTFERIMAAHEIAQDRWSYHLAPYLTGKAQQAYAALPPNDAKDYDKVKEAILRRYDITKETYRQRFRQLRPTESESPQEVVTRLQDLATRWTRESQTREELLDLVVREQFLSILPEDVRVAVIERQPKDCTEASKIAGNYLQARTMSIGKRIPRKFHVLPTNLGVYGIPLSPLPSAHDAVTTGIGLATAPREEELVVILGPRDSRTTNHYRSEKQR